MKLKALICATALAFAPMAATAATVVSAGNSYDIHSDNLFLGSAVDTDGGAGSYTVNFYSLVSPARGIANASVTLNVLGTFKNLTMSWIEGGTINVLATADLAAGITTLHTIFTQSVPSQDLTFAWTDSLAGVSFDFDVAAVPLPAAGLLMGAGLGGLGLIAVRRKKTRTA